MNFDLSSLSEFDMCDRIQEMLPLMNEIIPQKATTMEIAINNYDFDSPSDECFDCQANGKICGKSTKFGGKTVIYTSNLLDLYMNELNIWYDSYHMVHII